MANTNLSAGTENLNNTAAASIIGGTIAASTTYLIKSVIVTNKTASAVTIDMYWTNDNDTTNQFYLADDESIAAKSNVQLLKAPLTLVGGAGSVTDLKAQASAATSLDVTVNYVSIT